MEQETNVNLGAENGAAEQNQEPNQGEQNNGKTNEEQTAKTYSSEEVEKLLQSETDKRVDQALKTFREKELPGLLEKQKTEAEKMAKMTADQKAEHEKQKQLEALEKREAEITRRELRAEALQALGEKGLPKELADIVNYTDAESTSKSLEAIEESFRATVEEAVNERLKGKAPKGNAQGSSGTGLSAQLDEIFGLK